MPVYGYTFRDNNGSVQKGTAEADTEQVLRKRFEEQGFQILEVEVLRRGSTKPRSFGKVKLAKLSIFCRQFSTMVDAGVSLVRCLDVLGQQTEDPKLRKILADVGERVESGDSLSKAMQRHPATFNNLFIGLVRAGEVMSAMPHESPTMGTGAGFKAQAEMASESALRRRKRI
jgi:type IV pilus assembly protein PilC